MITLTPREIALSTSGLATLDDTWRASESLQPLLAPYPDPGDAAAWQHRRHSSAVSQNGLDDPRLSLTEIAGVPCRVVQPAGPATGNYLHVHGGGWAFGAHTSQDERLLALSDDTGLRIVSVGYRLAPEHTILDATEDTIAVARSVTGDGGWWAIGGESAGAQLAVQAILALRADEPHRFSAAVLTYGCYDLAGTPARMSEPGSGKGYANLFAAVTPSSMDRRDPKISPLYADLPGVIPARFMCGTRDSGLEDTLMMAARWQLHAEVELDIVAGAIHGFTLIPGPTTDHARRAEAAYLRGRLAQDTRQARGAGT
ncbi:MAG: alpha/beta hydrolase [Propionibacteriales bacterium]|nr:alpha/beta hydrolase [Propionibacteriales bacterium]